MHVIEAAVPTIMETNKHTNLDGTLKLLLVSSSEDCSTVDGSWFGWELRVCISAHNRLRYVFVCMRSYPFSTTYMLDVDSYS